MLCWMNGQFSEAEDLRISPFDHGFLYGIGFFETFRTYNGKIFLWQAHYKRLCEALAMYHVAMPYNADELAQIVAQLVQKNGGADGYFRLNVSAGVHDIGLKPQHYNEPTIIIFQKALQAAPRGTEKNAQWLQLARNTPENATRVKSHHYGNNVLARFEMPSLAATEGFFVTAEGYIAEGITSNIFWATAGKLYTPALQTGILAGTTRSWLLANADVEQGLFTQQALLQADECFITNAVQELVPIKQLGTKNFMGAQGNVYRKWHRAYVQAITEEC